MAEAAIPLFAAPFCFLRHGETELNRLGLVTGSADIELNATGLAQAREAARRLTGAGIDAIWCSPLRRARDTAQCVADALRLEISIVAELAERNWGELEGKPRNLRVRGATPPGGESREAFRERARSGFMRIRPSGLPLVVAHSGIFRVLCELLDIAQQDKPVANSVPLLVRPGAAAGAWTLEPL
jgi:broad specificity phosphatase PhoE